jgi:hypothetical protein
MADPDALLAAYDGQMRMTEAARLAPGVSAQRDGPIVRIVGQHPGFISSPSDLGLEGHELDALIARQRDFFAARGEAVEWKTRGHDRPAITVARLQPAGFVPEARETVMIGRAADLAPPPVSMPASLALRQTRDDGDMGRIAALQSEVWGHDMGWMADDLIGRVRADPDQIAVFVAEAGDQVVAAAGASIGRWWRAGPGGRSNAAPVSSRSTPPTTAARSSSGWASSPPRPTCGRRPDWRASRPQTKAGRLAGVKYCSISAGLTGRAKR